MMNDVGRHCQIREMEVLTANHMYGKVPTDRLI
jgi:hypothetical protein